MFKGLQEKSQRLKRGWEQLEPAIERIAEILAPRRIPEIASVVGENWWLELGPVDLSAELITIQRQDHLVVAMTRREDGRLRAAVYRPLDAGSASSLNALGLNPRPEGGVGTRDNNWEYALDASASSFRQLMAAEAGQSYKSYWEKGLGISHDNSEIPEWLHQRELQHRPNELVAVELGGQYQAYGSSNPEFFSPDPSEEVIPKAYPHWQAKRQWKRMIRGRFRGCLLGGTVGDALGAPVEFMSRQEILNTYSPKEILDYATAYGGLGKVTDDTQMTLFTA